MGPLAGVICSDYYLVRTGKLNVGELYNPFGLYSYNHGFNWRAFVSFMYVTHSHRLILDRKQSDRPSLVFTLSIPVSVLLPGLSYSIDPVHVKVNRGILHLYCELPCNDNSNTHSRENILFQPFLGCSVSSGTFLPKVATK